MMEDVARTYAKDFLRPLVQRGDSVKKACQYPCAHACGMLWTAQIGGNVYYQGKLHHIKSDQVVIKEMAGETCLYVFDVTELFRELGASPLAGPLYQLSIWD